MAVYIELLACKFISKAARKDLERAACPIHSEVPGLDSDIEVVELQHAGEKDHTGIYDEWGVPREVRIMSRGLYLNYKWNDEINGYGLTSLEEELKTAIYEQVVPEEEFLADLDNHLF